MPIASALVITDPHVPAEKVINLISALNGVESCISGPKGLAVVFETDDMRRLKELTGEINSLEEVIDIQLAYLNWEDLE
jgi:nitrate reductase NapAB chaperone NapD